MPLKKLEDCTIAQLEKTLADMKGLGLEAHPFYERVAQVLAVKLAQ